jgi:predicted DCC family thiol-disulfide oxidoreductase YuxK
MTDSSKSAPLLLFDGVCNLCNGYVQWLLLRDKKGIFRFAALQSETGQAHLRKLGYDTAVFDTVLLICGDRVYTRSDVALEICRLLGLPWSLLYGLKLIPRALRNAVYDLVARYRYRWFGRQEACLMPRPEWKNRFI